MTAQTRHIVEHDVNILNMMNYVKIYLAHPFLMFLLCLYAVKCHCFNDSLCDDTEMTQT